MSLSYKEKEEILKEELTDFASKLWRQEDTVEDWMIFLEAFLRLTQRGDGLNLRPTVEKILKEVLQDPDEDEVE